MDIRDRLRGLFSPAHANGTSLVKHEPAAPEAKGYPSLSPDFVGPSTARLYVLGDHPSSDVEEVNRRTAYAAALYAYVAMRYRAEKYSEAGLIVAETTAEGEKWVEGHELDAFLALPHPDLDMGELLRTTRLYRDFSGSALWVKEADRMGRPARVTPFSGDQFTVEAAQVGGVNRMHGRFRVEVRGGTEVYGPDDVVFFRESSIYSWTKGMAPLDVALAMLNLGKAATSTVRTILRNALFPSMVVQADKDWHPSKEELEEWRAALEELGATDRKGSPVGLTGGGTATRVTMTLKDLIPSDILDRVEASVAAAFGVPSVVLGFLAGLKNSPWSQMAEARRMGYEDTIEPMWRRDSNLLSTRLLRAPWGTRGQVPDPNPRRLLSFDTSTIRALQADQLKLAEIAEKNGTYWRVNEARLFTGQEALPPDDPRGDLIPGLQPAPAAPGEEEEGQETDDAPGGQAAGPSPSSRTRKAPVAKADRATRWKLWDARVGGQEFSWELAAGEQLAMDQELVLELARTTLSTRKADGDPIDPESVRRFRQRLDEELEGAEERWKRAVAPQVAATASASAQLVASQVGLSFDVLQPGIEAFTRKHAAQLVTQVTETTRAYVRAAVANGLKEGEGIDRIQERLQTSGAFGPTRARLIARTETTTVTNRSGRQALETWSEEAGQRIVKSWLATADARTRDEHRELDGEERPLEKAFSNGLQEPSEPNCRCTLEYRILED